MKIKIRRKTLKRALWSILIVFILMNVMAIVHAYSFTHFSEGGKKTNSENLSFGEKLKVLAFGISNPRPTNATLPSRKYETITLQSNKRIECWNIHAENPKGTVILFHGYSGEKSSMIDKSDVFLAMGYNTILVDFMGSGGSEGNQTTIGFYEAEEVKSCYDYVKNTGEKHIYLFGTSMGAAAAMKAINDYHIQPEGLIIECPFGTMYKTVCARFKNMGVPTFPMAGLLTFWGGVINDFNAFDHNPEEYAKKITCPTLLMYGAKDNRVSQQEIRTIYQYLKGKKTLKVYQEAGHENYLKNYKKEWKRDVSVFMEEQSNDLNPSETKSSILN